MPGNTRPNGLDLKSANSYDSSRNTNFSLGDLPSPKVGEIPPALSPLDAFAYQGRLLAKRFEEKKNGRRISRLPALTIQEELIAARPGYFRSISEGSNESAGQDAKHDDHPPEGPEAARGAREVQPDTRPISMHPSIEQDAANRESRLPFRNELSRVDEGRQMPPVPPLPTDYFAIPRAQSPDQMEPPRMGNVKEATPISPVESLRSRGGSQSSSGVHRTLTADSARSYASNSLQPPPKSPARAARSPRASPSIRSVPGDGSDVEGLSLGSSVDSLPPPRVSSRASNHRSRSPASPYMPPSMKRSPSASSEYSVGGSRLPPPSFNFSRPRSGTRPSLDSPSRQNSGDTTRTRPSLDTRPSLISRSRQNSGDSHTQFANDMVHTPVSMTSEDCSVASDSQRAGQSYIYSKYDLPRGRPLDRGSLNAEDFMKEQIRWSGPLAEGADAATPTTPTEETTAPPSPPRSIDLPDGRNSNAEADAPSVHSSNATIRAQMSSGQQAKRASGELTPEEHLDKGIACHEAGSLAESTYHFRIAARAGLATAMLFYALACRHGWGMRPNPAEGVQWLRKAVDSAQLEVADDEDAAKQGKGPDAADKKSHKAQFALSIYELGVSYMNGWGIGQDKALALRCFEIAGNWGDADALTEAGFCYTEGVGCKKDLKKAARFYRMAEAKGVSMAGNSWIYKPKYMDDGGNVSDSGGRGRSTEVNSPASKKAGGRDKSRTRTIFGRKKERAGAGA